MSRVRRSVLKGALERCRWMLAEASLRLRPPAADTPSAATPATLREAASRQTALNERLESLVAGQEAKLAANADPSAGSSSESIWLAATARLAAEIAAVQRTAPASKPDSRADHTKVEVAIAALERTIVDIERRAMTVEQRVQELQGEAESAIVARNDDAALRALRHRSVLAEALVVCRRELDLRREILAQWQLLSNGLKLRDPNRS